MCCRVCVCRAAAKRVLSKLIEPPPTTLEWRDEVDARLSNLESMLERVGKLKCVVPGRVNELILEQRQAARVAR